MRRYDGVDFYIPKPIRQHATGRLGLFRTILVEEKAMTVQDKFRKEAESTGPKHPSNPEEVEREFWKKVTYTPPLYGADVEVREPTTTPPPTRRLGLERLIWADGEHHLLADGCMHPPSQISRDREPPESAFLVPRKLHIPASVLRS